MSISAWVLPPLSVAPANLFGISTVFHHQLLHQTRGEPQVSIADITDRLRDYLDAGPLILYINAGRLQDIKYRLMQSVALQ